MDCCQCLRGGRWTGGRPLVTLQGQRSERGKAGGLTTVQLNKPEEVMLTIVTAVSYVRLGGHVFRPVCLSGSYQDMSNTT